MANVKRKLTQFRVFPFKMLYYYYMSYYWIVFIDAFMCKQNFNVAAFGCGDMFCM